MAFTIFKAFMYVCVSGRMGAWMDARENTHYSPVPHSALCAGAVLLQAGRGDVRACTARLGFVDFQTLHLGLGCRDLSFGDSGSGGQQHDILHMFEGLYPVNSTYSDLAVQGFEIRVMMGAGH